MSGGGPSTAQPQDNSIQLEQMRQAAADRETKRIADEKAQNKLDYDKRLGTAVEGARITGRDYFASRGLSSDTYGSLLDSIINDTKLKVPELDTKPGSYFTTDAFESGLSNAEKVKRANFTGKVDTTFDPGFEKRLISDTADDSILDSILGTQRGEAQKQIDFNRARGVLNDSGYATVQNELKGQEGAARSTLTGIGDSILGKKRQDLLNIRGDAGKAATGYTFGAPDINVDNYYKDAQSKATSGLSDLEGSIRASLGSTSLFDVPTLLQKGGTAQGPINVTTAGADTSLPFDPKKSNTKRGLGSTSTF